MAAKGTLKWILLSGAAGAAGIYFLDRECGHQRRTRLKQGAERLARTIAERAELGVRDSRHRLLGMARDAWSRIRREQFEDRVLVERIRSRLGRIVLDPRKIHVTSDQGSVTLWGLASADEIRKLIHVVKGMKNVKEVRDHLEVEEGREARAAMPDSFQQARNQVRLNWTPAQRLLAAAAGTAGAVYGWRRHDYLGTSLSLAGSGLAAYSLLTKNIHSLLALSEESPGFELERTVRINAPISDLYDFWSNPENYPRVFAHITSIERLGENLYRWTLNGPAGIPTRWEGTITRMVPNTLVEWKSLPGSTVGNFGIARFDPNYDASTRVQIRMFYRPPAGILGRFLAELFGAKPGKVLDEDLARLKLLFETDQHLLKELRASKGGGDEQLLKIAKT